MVFNNSLLFISMSNLIKINIMDMKRHILIYFLICMLVSKKKSEVVIRIEVIMKKKSEMVIIRMEVVSRKGYK